MTDDGVGAQLLVISKLCLCQCPDIVGIKHDAGRAAAVTATDHVVTL